MPRNRNKKCFGGEYRRYKRWILCGWGRWGHISRWVPELHGDYPKSRCSEGRWSGFRDSVSWVRLEWVLATTKIALGTFVQAVYHSPSPVTLWKILMSYQKKKCLEGIAKFPPTLVISHKKRSWSSRRKSCINTSCLSTVPPGTALATGFCKRWEVS